MIESLIKTKVQNPEKVKQKHHQIVEAAILLFSKNGFHKTSMREIAKASGIELSYLYKYISSKDDILLLFYESLHKRYFPVFQEMYANPDMDPAEQLVKMIKLMFEISAGYYKQTIVAYTETRHLRREYFDIVMGKEKMYNEAFQNLIERGMKAGCFTVSDPLITATFVMHMMLADITRGWCYRGERTTEQTRDELIIFVLKALMYKGDYHKLLEN